MKPDTSIGNGGTGRQWEPNLDAADLHAIDEAQAEWRLMRAVAEAARRNPGCGACAHYLPADYDAAHGACAEGDGAWVRMTEGRVRRGLHARRPQPLLVEAHGAVPCGYEDFEPADWRGWEE